jgi:hypothetical protein
MYRIARVYCDTAQAGQCANQCTVTAWPIAYSERPLAVKETGMPVGYHINPDEGLITVTADGRVPLSEFVNNGERLLKNSEYDPKLPHLIDLRGLRPLRDQSLNELREFVEQCFRDRVSASVAVVIDRFLERAHCADIFLLTCALHDAELFADYDHALRWLMRRVSADQAWRNQPSITSTPTTMPTTLQNT